MSTAKDHTIYRHKKNDNGIFKIIAIIVTLLIIAGGAIQFSIWLQGQLTRRVEASALEKFDQASALLAEGDHEGALNALSDVLERVENPDISPTALLLEADIHFAANRADMGVASLNAILESYPQSAESHDAALRVARIHEESGNIDEALKLYRQIKETAPASIRAPATTALGREQERAGDLVAAWTLYNEASQEAEWGSEAWMESVDRLGALNTQIFFSNRHTEDSKVYTVSQGDSLTSIGSKLNVTQGQLMRANGITNPDALRPNQALKFTPKDFRIVIERSTTRIYLLDQKGVFKVYIAGLGKPGNDTTLGKYKIGNKEKNPTWHKPGSKPIPGGAPGNELGSRWLPLVPEEEGLPIDLGIHGTIKPDSIGTYASMGCPRMHNAEVEELYDLVVRSTPVEIVEVYTPQS